MSTVTAAPAERTADVPPGKQLWRRSAAVARMHLVDVRTLVAMPLGIVASVFVINLLIWQFIPASGRQTGGAASICVFLLVVAILAVVRGLPFAFGMGASRRTFLGGTMLAGGALAAGFGLLYFALQWAEHASGGWWQQGNFFWFDWFGRSPKIVDLLFLVVSLGTVFMLGAWIAACWMRWNTLTLVVGGPLAVLIVGGAVVVVTWQEWWHHVGRWFAALTPLTGAGWCALAVVLLAGASHLALRRVRG